MSKENWEEEFDKIQAEQSYTEYTTERFCCGGDYCEGDHNGFIKAFIHSLLKAKGEEIKNRIEDEMLIGGVPKAHGWRCDKCSNFLDECRCPFNSGLTTATEIISNILR